MKLRVACKIVSKSYWVDDPPYKDSTLDKAVAKLWARRGRWHAPGCRRRKAA